ncbi:MAG: BON domain-containing protein [Nitriliruptorales bacterium]|nr:BON domain-containing protein [Nitriliruptorales bacterium]
MRLRTWFALGVGAAAGAALTYLFDPEQGEQRRRETAELARQKAEEFDLDKKADFYAGQIKGNFVEALESAKPAEASYDPKTLIRKVESEVLGPASVNAGDIAVDADDDGIVTLRGEVANQRVIDELVAATQGVEGVSDVTNLLHLPSEPTPGTPEPADVAGNGAG